MELSTVVENLNKRRFLAELCPTAQHAQARVLELIGDKSVGIGGSNTVKSLGLFEALKQRGNTVFCHTYADTPAGKNAQRRAAMGADAYLCSMNAITFDGVLVNIDGTGNRVAATMFGPPEVIIVAGRNKLAETVEAGIARTRRDCCPLNARRLGMDTPCARTGECYDCHTPARMCNATVLLEYPTRAVKAFHVLLIDEDVGW